MDDEASDLTGARRSAPQGMVRLLVGGILLAVLAAAISGPLLRDWFLVGLVDRWSARPAWQVAVFGWLPLGSVMLAGSLLGSGVVRRGTVPARLLTVLASVGAPVTLFCFTASFARDIERTSPAFQAAFDSPAAGAWRSGLMWPFGLFMGFGVLMTLQQRRAARAAGVPRRLRRHYPQRFGRRWAYALLAGTLASLLGALWTA